MATIEGATIGPDGSIFLTDWFRNEIVQYSSTGTRIGVFTAGGGMLQPNGLVFALTNRTVVSVKESHGSLPLNHELKQNFPNPFNPTTRINCSLSKPYQVTLKIFDAAGRLVSTLINETLSEGEYNKVWDGHNMHSGLYFYQLTAGNISETKKMILLK